MLETGPTRFRTKVLLLPESLLLASRNFNMHRRAIGQHFGHTGGDFIGVVAHANDRVGGQLRRVIDHELVGVGSRALAHLGIECDVAAQQCLQAGADGSDNAAGTDDDAADNAQSFRDAITRKFKSSTYKFGIYRHSYSFPS